MTSRRAVLGALSASAIAMCARVVNATVPHYRVVVLGRGTRRTLVLLPSGLDAGRPARLLVALHGRGEAHDPEIGVRAWLDRYGLGSAYERLSTPPLASRSRRGDWAPGRIDELNGSLARVPFAGLVVACPFTPDPARTRGGASAVVRELGRYVVEELVPEVRTLGPIVEGAEGVRVDGCSMGGPLAIELFLARPDRFGALGIVQAAMGPHRAAGYAERLRAARMAHHRDPVHVLTSTADPFREGAEALSRELTRAGVDASLRVAPGPHDQPWLRESGTIEMLVFHERGPVGAPAAR
jgi:enterochelin esterase-like enzyme